MTKKTVTVKFNLSFSSTMSIQVGAEIKIPETAGTPYALTQFVINAKSIQSLPYAFDKSLTALFLTTFNKYMFVHYKLDSVELLTAALKKHAPEDSGVNFENLAFKVNAFFSMPDKHNIFVGLSLEDEKNILLAACIFYYLRHDLYIDVVNENNISIADILSNENEMPTDAMALFLAAQTALDFIFAGSYSNATHIVVE